jgi:hypothetical protein
VQSKKGYYKTMGDAMARITLKSREMEVWERFAEGKWVTVRVDVQDYKITSRLT